MISEIELIESFPSAVAAEAVILIRRLAYLRASVSGLSDTRLMVWEDVRTRGHIIDKLIYIDAMWPTDEFYSWPQLQ